MKRWCLYSLVLMAAVSGGYSQSTPKTFDPISYPITVRAAATGSELVEDANRDLWLVNDATNESAAVPLIDARGFAMSDIGGQDAPVLWAATSSGIFRLEKSQWQEIKELESPATSVYASDGTIAVGTEAGLVTFMRAGAESVGTDRWVTVRAADEAIRLLTTDPEQPGILLAGSIAGGQTLSRIDLTAESVDTVSAAKPALHANAVAGPCYDVQSLDQSYNSFFNTGKLTIRKLRSGCAGWSVRRGDTWIIFTSATTGTGDFQVTYNILGNPSAGNRTSSIIVTVLGDRSYTAAIHQTGPTPLPTGCNYTVTPSRFDLTEQYQVAQFQVNTTAGCAYFSSENEPWITLVSGQSATGPGTLRFQVLFNSTYQRSGTIQIGTPSGKTFQVLINQQGVVR